MLPSESDVLEFISSHASVLVRDRKYPRWTQAEIVSELFILWSGLADKYGQEMDGRWRGLLKTAAARRFPDQYQKSIGMKIRRDPKEGMKRRYFTDAELMGPDVQTEYSPRGASLGRRADAEGQNTVGVGGRLRARPEGAERQRLPRAVS